VFVRPPKPEGSSSTPADVLRKLQDVTDAALAHLELDELLDELLMRVRDALETDTCAVLLLDDTGTELVARAAKGLEEEVERGVRVPVGKGFAGRVAATRAPVQIEDLDHADVVNPLLREKGIRSMLGVPLIVAGRLLGIMHVGTLTLRNFTEDDTNLLQVVAERVARGIDHALMYDELVRVSQVQRDFVTLAAHELRTPAATVYGLAMTLHARVDELDEGTKAELRETMYEQADRLRRLVEQLLDLSRLDSRTVEIRRARVALKPHLESVARAVVPIAGEIAVQVPAELEAEVDASAIEHVVVNLITNAIRYGSPPITVTAECKDRHLRIAVEDRGEGVQDEFVPHLFDRFQRGERSRAVSGGTGLGLAIAQSYAHAHGGNLVYTPLRPQGSRFELVIPAVPDD
jgi:signal transduction histidine kinase